MEINKNCGTCIAVKIGVDAASIAALLMIASFGLVIFGTVWAQAAVRDGDMPSGYLSAVADKRTHIHLALNLTNTENWAEKAFRALDEERRLDRLLRKQKKDRKRIRRPRKVRTRR